MTISMDRPTDTRSSRLCGTFLGLAPVTGAVVSILAGSTGVSTLCASDRTAKTLDRLQFELGEGPAWAALATGQPVLAPDFSTDGHYEWPKFRDAVDSHEDCSGVAAMFGFPLIIGSISIGTVDLYSTTPIQLSDAHLGRVTVAVEDVASRVLERILADSSHEPSDNDDSYGWSPHQINQATQILVEDQQMNEADGALLMRANAFATGRSVTRVAADVILGRVDFRTNRL